MAIRYPSEIRRKLATPRYLATVALKKSVCGKVSDFQLIRGLYGEEFVDRIVGALNESLRHLATESAYKYVAILKSFLQFVPIQFSKNARKKHMLKVYSDLVGYTTNSAVDQDWEYTFQMFSREIFWNYYSTFRNGMGGRTKSNYLDSFNALRRHIFPKLGWPMGKVFATRLEFEREFDHSRPALGELLVGKKLDQDSTFDVINRRNVTRLQRLRDICEDILISERDKFASRDGIISSLSIKTYRRFEYYVDNVPEYPRNPAEYRPLNLSHDVLLACGLRYIAKFYHKGWKYFYGRTVFKRILSPVGGIEALKSYFAGSMQAMIAAHTIVMIDTGMNLEVCNQLRADCLKSSVRSGKVELHTIESFKARANYRPIRAHLLHPKPKMQMSATPGNNRLSGFDTLNIWLELSLPLRKELGEDPRRDVLWIGASMRNGLKVRPTAVDWNQFWSQHFLSDPELGRLKVSRAMIRSTYVQIEFARNGADAQFVSKLVGHSSSQTTLKSYLNKPYIQRYFDELVYDFQNQLFSVIGSIRVRAEQMFLSLAELQQVRSKAVENGLGFMCTDPTSGFQTGMPGTVCHRIDACTHCPLLKFNPEVNSVVDLLRFKRQLEQVSEEFIASNAALWKRVWLPSLALCIAVVELLGEGVHRRILNSAIKVLATEPVTDGGLRPW